MVSSSHLINDDSHCQDNVGVNLLFSAQRSAHETETDNYVPLIFEAQEREKIERQKRNWVAV
jgi:hypothetical protein